MPYATDQKMFLSNPFTLQVAFVLLERALSGVSVRVALSRDTNYCGVKPFEGTNV
jgi:hypothetical protein